MTLVSLRKDARAFDVCEKRLANHRRGNYRTHPAVAALLTVVLTSANHKREKFRTYPAVARLSSRARVGFDVNNSEYSQL